MIRKALLLCFRNQNIWAKHSTCLKEHILQCLSRLNEIFIQKKNCLELRNLWRLHEPKQIFSVLVHKFLFSTVVLFCSSLSSTTFVSSVHWICINNTDPFILHPPLPCFLNQLLSLMPKISVNDLFFLVL